MKTVAAILAIGVILLLGFMVYFKEEPPPPPPKRTLKFKIVKPPKQQKPEKQKAQIPEDQEKGQFPAKEAQEGKAAVVGKIPKKKIEGKAALIEEKPAKRLETVIEKEGMDEYYIVKKGESLCDVASREDVYGNMLKWPALYRLNIESLANLKTEGDVVERALPEGLKLRIVGPDEVEENLKKRPNKRWVVNVLSSTTNENIVRITMALIKNGHSAYLTQARIKGKVWTRLRVGFFNNRQEADMERKKITRTFNISDAWSVKLGQMEFKEFAGY
jgi:cell division protein FtsN